jgi:hypothetical protein
MLSWRATATSLLRTGRGRDRDSRLFHLGRSLQAPLRVCVVGSGPGAFYTAKYILESKTSGCEEVCVDMLEKLPVPYGLVRFGVAPDHPEVKNVTDTFEQIAQNPRFRYLGNVCVGSDVSLGALLQRYSAVVLGCGADGNRRLLGENAAYDSLEGVYSAREFVNWYNGHPSFVDYTNAFQLDKVKNVVIVGHGNVAVDCARILTKNVDELKETDIADYAITALQKSTVRTVTLIGRRGPVQSAFTIKELRELTRLGQGVQVVTDAEAFATGMRDEDSLAAYSTRRPVKRLTDLIKTTVGDLSSIANSTADKSIVLRYLLTPFAYLSKSSPMCGITPSGPVDPLAKIEKAGGQSLTEALAADAARLTASPPPASRAVGAIVCARNEFLPNEKVQVIERHASVPSPAVPVPAPSAPVPTPAAPVPAPAPAAGDTAAPWATYATAEVIPCDLLLTAVGYQSNRIEDSTSTPLPAGTVGYEVPFDDNRHIVPNIAGRVQLMPSNSRTNSPSSDSAAQDKGLLYAVGWVGRGPTGIIGTNIPDAKQTAESVISDLVVLTETANNKTEANTSQDPKEYIESLAALQKKKIISWDEFLKINSEEIRRGEVSVPPRPRVKITDTTEMIRVASE